MKISSARVSSGGWQRSRTSGGGFNSILLGSLLLSMLICGCPPLHETPASIQKEVRQRRDNAVVCYAVKGRRTTLSGFTSAHNLVMAFSPDGKLLAISVGTFSSVLSFGDLWVLDLGKQQTVFRANLPLPMRALSFSGDGKRLVALGRGAGVVYETSRWQEVCRFKASVFEPSELSVSPDGTTLAYATLSDIRLLSVPTGRERQLFAYSADVPDRHVLYAPNGRLLAGSVGSDLHLWNTSTWRHRKLTLPMGTSDLYHEKPFLCFSTDSRLLAIDAGERIILVDAAATKVLRTIGIAGCMAARFSADGKHLYAVAPKDEDILLHKVRTADGRVLSSSVLLPRNLVDTLSSSRPAAAFSPDAKTFAVDGMFGTVIVVQAIE